MTNLWVISIYFWLLCLYARRLAIQPHCRIPAHRSASYLHSLAIQLAQNYYSYTNPDLYDISFDLT